MNAAEVLILAIDTVKQYLDRVPDENVRDVTGLALDMLGEGAEGFRDQSVTPEELRRGLEHALPSKWEAMIRAKFHHDTDPAPQPVADELNLKRESDE